MGRRPAAVAVEAQVPGTDRVPDDQQHVPGRGGWGREGGGSPMVRPGAGPGRRQREDQHDPDEHGAVRRTNRRNPRRRGPTIRADWIASPAAQHRRRPDFQGQDREQVEEPDERGEPHGDPEGDRSSPQEGDQGERHPGQQDQRRDPRGMIQGKPSPRR